MSVLPVRIDRASPVPLYHQLAEQLTAAVTDGTLSPGDAFENEVALAARLGLSRPTVRRAIAELVGRGLLVRRRGIGTTVANQAVHRRAELTSLYDDLLREGRAPSTQVLSLQTGVTDERAAVALGLDPSTSLVAVVRLRYAGDVPLAVLRNWLPSEFSDLTAEQLQAEGLYALLRRRGVRPAVARQSFGARNATAHERRLLQLTKAGASSDDDPHGVRRGWCPGRVRRPLLPRRPVLGRCHGLRTLTKHSRPNTSESPFTTPTGPDSVPPRCPDGGDKPGEWSKGADPMWIRALWRNALTTASTGCDDVQLDRGLHLRVQTDERLERAGRLDRAGELDLATVELGAAGSLDGVGDVTLGHGAEEAT